jgi:uncharacterized membrane protein
METASNQSPQTPPGAGAPRDAQAARPSPSGDSPTLTARSAISGTDSSDAAARSAQDEQATLGDGQRIAPLSAPLSAPRRQRITAPPASSVAPPDAAPYYEMPPPTPQRQPLRSPYAAPPAAPPQHPGHVPWRAEHSWGPTMLSIDANTAAGASYLLWWLSGVLVYFNERNNRYVRFHAVQAILLTSALTVLGVLAYILAALGHDLWRVTHWTVFEAFGNGLAWLAVIFIVVVWLTAMVGAWTGNHLHWPIVGTYAERYAAPPIQQQSTPPVS